MQTLQSQLNKTLRIDCIVMISQYTPVSNQINIGMLLKLIFESSKQYTIGEVASEHRKADTSREHDTKTILILQC